jgi:hypothetical protein
MYSSKEMHSNNKQTIQFDLLFEGAFATWQSKREQKETPQ